MNATYTGGMITGAVSAPIPQPMTEVEVQLQEVARLFNERNNASLRAQAANDAYMGALENLCPEARAIIEDFAKIQPNLRQRP